MDSRVLASRFTYSGVGDNLIVRNAGNLIPCVHDFNYHTATTEGGALELGCIRNNVRHVVVCGHSDCKVCIGYFHEYIKYYISLLFFKICATKKVQTSLLYLNKIATGQVARKKRYHTP